MKNTTSTPKRSLENIVGNTLRYGVWISCSLTGLGLILMLIQSSKSPFQPESLPAEPIKFSFETLFSDLMHFSPAAIAMLGIFVLLITPLLRVIFALIGYWIEGNKLYTIITSVVLIIIGISVWIGAAH